MVYMYIHVQYIVRPGPFTRQLVERMRQDHRVNKTSENCVSMYVFVPSNFLLMLYYIILNLKKEYGNCGGRVNLKVGQPKTKTKTETRKKKLPPCSTKKKYDSIPPSLHIISLSVMYIYIDWTQVRPFLFSKSRGGGGKREREKKREKKRIYFYP